MTSLDVSNKAFSEALDTVVNTLNEWSKTKKAAESKAIPFVYDALRALAPADALNADFWTTLNERAEPYVRMRWTRSFADRSGGPVSDQDGPLGRPSTSWVKTRGALSRLWWAGYKLAKAEKVAPLQGWERDRIPSLLDSSEFVQGFFDRTSLSGRPVFARAILAFLCGGEPLKSEELKPFFKAIVARSGGLLFEAMEREAIDRLLMDCATAAGIKEKFPRTSGIPAVEETVSGESADAGASTPHKPDDRPDGAIGLPMDLILDTVLELRRGGWGQELQRNSLWKVLLGEEHHFQPPQKTWFRNAAAHEGSHLPGRLGKGRADIKNFLEPSLRLVAESFTRLPGRPILADALPVVVGGADWAYWSQQVDALEALCMCLRLYPRPNDLGRWVFVLEGGRHWIVPDSPKRHDLELWPDQSHRDWLGIALRTMADPAEQLQEGADLVLRLYALGRAEARRILQT